MTTYGLAILVLLAAGLSAVAKDLLRLMTAPQYHDAWRVIPPITIAVTLQGWYLLTSIGLNITKRTQYYPLAAGAAAATNVLANIILIPRFGMMGPAWSNVISYAVLAGIAFALSQRFYPIQYEYGRVVRVVVAGAAAYVAAVLLVPDVRLAVVGLLIRGIIVLAVYPAVLGVTGFFHARELARLKTLSLQLRSARVRKAEKGLEAPEAAAAEQMAEDAAGLAGFEEER
jgi:O-antigen/teichoic acid export membrane protein